MAEGYSPIARIAGQLSRLPGIGNKSALRLAYHIASMTCEQADELAAAISEGRRSILICSVCGDYTEQDPCPICSDTSRNQEIICVVKDPRDVAAIERMRDYHGTYHVLHGTISPMNGIGPDDIRIRELLSRVQNGTVREVILATNPDIEGEATANYIAKLLKPTGVLVTRIAHGLPVGGNLEYTDAVTLSKALEGRRSM
ncbi:MAG: recombination mediator RecR [Clostridiales bacterium]|nr:recombination mediator RecR [Clostridiales bacterium]